MWHRPILGTGFFTKSLHDTRKWVFCQVVFSCMFFLYLFNHMLPNGCPIRGVGRKGGGGEDKATFGQCPKVSIYIFFRLLPSGTVHKLCQPYLGGSALPFLLVTVSIWLTPLPPLWVMSAFGYSYFPSFRFFKQLAGYPLQTNIIFLIGKISNKIYYKSQSKLW